MQLDGDERLLLIDTCGENAGVALSFGPNLVSAAELSQGKASAEIVGTVRQLLSEAGWGLGDLAAVGVVSGPGSFTGMRTGLAAAKGFCEAAGLRLAAVSRLEVLIEAGRFEQGFAVLDAGRQEIYVRECSRGSTAREYVCREGDVEAVFGQKAGLPIVAGDLKSAERLAAFRAVLRPLTVRDALPAVMRAVRASVGDPALAEANYVRMEHDMYPRNTSA